MRDPRQIRFRHLGFISLLAVLFVLLSPVYATLVSVTAEFQVNTGTGSGAALLDFRSDIGVNTTTGDYVVVWQSDQSATESDVFFQRYNSSGVAQGSNTRVHAANVNDQRRPRVAVNSSNGDFVVVWESDADATASFDYNVNARVFNASGTALTAEIVVAGAAGAQTDARVAMNSSGNFVVAWQSLGDGSSTGIYFQRYNSTGTPQGSATQANVSTTNPQVFPAVAMSDTGNFVIVWRDASLGVATPDIRARAFDPVGAALTGEVTVGSTTNLQSNPVISMRQSTGDFVVVWESNAAFANAQVYFQRYNSSLTPQGSETLVSTNTGDVNQTADVSMNSTGDFMITWARTVTAGTEFQIQARRYNASGTSLGTEFRVDTAAGQDTTPVVGYTNSNYALFAWSSSPNNELYARLFADAADLVISKTSAVTGFPAYNNTNFVPGATLTYTITVTNNGPSPVVGAVVTDTLPPELSGATWTCTAAGTASCISGSPSGTGAAGAGNINQSIDIAAGGGNTITFTLTKLIPTTQLTSFTNTASVALPATTTDTNTSNNIADRTLSPIEVFDLSATKTDSPDPVTAGRDITYTITVANAGPSVANTVQLSDILPTNTTFVSLTAPGGWSCTTPAVGGTGTVNCSISSLAPAANGIFTLVVRVNPGTASGTVITNTASASANTSASRVDSNTGNNDGTATTTVAAPVLVFVQQPTNTNAGAAITPAVTIEVRDSTNAVITNDNTTQISLAIGTNPGSGTLTGGGAVTVVNGVATFAGLSINNPGVGYTLTASSTGATSVNSNPFNITSQPATQLTFGVQPSDAAAGASITPSITVEVRDASNAIVTGDNSTQVTLTINNNPSGGTLGGTVTQTAVNGVATFNNVSIDLVGVGYTLDADATGLTGDTSTAFNITAGAADHLAFVQQPTDTTAGAAISPAVTVEIRDAFDNLVTTSSATVNLTIGTNPGGGTLSGTVSAAAVNGVATFNNLSIDLVGVGYTLDADSSGLTGDTSTAFNINAGAADHLTFVQQPTDTTAGAAITPAVTVEVRDAFDNLVTTSSATVNLTIGTNPSGGTLSGTVSAAAVNGVATFNTLSIDQAGSGYTLDASSTGLTGDTSTPFNITAGAPAQLVFFQQPPASGIAGLVLSPSIVVEIQDALGNTVPTAGTNITLAIGTNPSGGTLSGTLTRATNISGFAVFNDLSINLAGVGYTLVASSAGLSNVTSSAFDIAAAAPSQIVFVQQPTDTAVNSTITPAVTLQIQDAFGNATGPSGLTVTLAIGTDPSGGTATLGGTTSAFTTNGAVSFNNLSLDRVGVGYTLTASVSSPTITGATSTAFNITAAAADHVAFVQQPTNTQAGAAITPAVTVEIRDAFNNVVTTSSANVTVAIGTNPSGGTLSGTVTVAAINGVATFNNLSINLVGTGYTLTAASAGLTGDTSAAFNITAGAPAAIVFGTQPSDATAGTVISPSVTVEVRDASNNLVTTDNGTAITLAIGTNPGSGTLSGTVTQPTVNGVATFPGLSIDKSGTGYMLVASAGGYSNATSAAFNITAAAADHLAFVQQPTNSQAGAAIAPPITVRILDAFDNLVTTSSANVTVAIGTNPGTGTLSGTATVAAVNGVATFSTLSIDKVGIGYTLDASSSGLTGTTSTAFNISAGAPAQLEFVQQPTNTTAGNTITPSVTVQVLDAFDNVVTGDNSTQITLAIGTNPGSGTLNGTVTRTVVNGVATFNDLSINQAGIGYTLTASAAGLTGDISSAFNISPAAPVQLAFVQQPTTAFINTTIAPAVTVQITDSYGNPVPLGGQPITLAIGTNPGGGTLGGTTTQASNGSGLATFNNLSINQVGVGYTLTASAPGLTGATSTAFDITFAAPDHLSFAQQPTNTVAGNLITPAITVEVRDTLNNVITTDNLTSITLAIGTNPGSGTLNGTITRTVVNGVATFNDLSINQAGVGYTLTASTAGLTGDTSSAFNISPASPVQLVFVQQPSNTAVNATISPAITVQINDSYGNPVPLGGQPITLAIDTNPSGGTFGGTTTQVSNGSGLATFNNLSIDQVGVGYTLTASAPGLAGATSAAFNIAAGAPALLVFVQQPTNTVAGSTVTPAVTVEVRDTFNNVITTDNSTQITLAIGTNPGSGTLNGTVTQTVVNGVATFANLSINQAGVGYTLTASTSGLPTATSSAFDITAAAAAAVIFVQQPTNTIVNGTMTPAVTVQVVDAFNNVVPAAGTTITLAIGTNPSGGTLGGTLAQVTNGAGLAAFSDLTIDQVGTGYTLTASAAGLTGATSTAFDITAGIPSQIAFNVQPTTTNIGAAITPAVTVEVRDALNNVITTDNTTQITVAIGTNPGGGTLGGTLTQTVVNGVATFADLTIDRVGVGYTLAASSSGFASVTSNAFDVTNLPPTQLVFAQQPTNTLVNAAIMPSITVELRNVLNAVVTTDNTTQVTIAIGSNPGAGVLSGTLTRTAVNGIVTFPGLSIDQAGVGYTLTASAPGLTGATSNTFDVFTVPNDTIVGVVFNDLNGNGVQDPGDVNMIGITVFLDANSNGGLDSGELNTLTDASGMYSFVGLSAGSYNVRIIPSTGFSVTTSLPVVVNVPQSPVIAIAIGQRENTQPTGVPPTTPTEVPSTDPRAWSLVLTADPAFVNPGGTTTITMTLSKLAGGTVVNASAALPAGFTINSVSSNRGTATYNGTTITFTDDMHVGDVAVIVANVRVPQLGNVWTLTGCVTSPASLCAQTTLTVVGELPQTGEVMPDALRFAFILGIVGTVALVVVGLVSKAKMKQ